MSYRPYQEIVRRKSRRVYVGKVPVGDGAPITVQTMTNTLTTDVAGTIAQIRLAEIAGVDIVRAREGSDPAAVVFDAISSGKAKGRDPILVDTAGRLHTRVNLMQELIVTAALAGLRLSIPACDGSNSGSPKPVIGLTA